VPTLIYSSVHETLIEYGACAQLVRLIVVYHVCHDMMWLPVLCSQCSSNANGGTDQPHLVFNLRLKLILKKHIIMYYAMYWFSNQFMRITLGISVFDE